MPIPGGGGGGGGIDMMSPKQYKASLCPSGESLDIVAYTTRRVMVLKLPRWSLGVVPLKVQIGRAHV